MRLSRAITWMLAALAVVPLTAPIAMAAAGTDGALGEAPGLLKAYANSCILAFISASLTLLLAAYLLFWERRLRECGALAALLFVLPGSFVAIGTSHFMHFAFGRPPRFAQAVALILIEADYIFPFVVTALITAFFAIGPSKLGAAHEMTHNPAALLRTLGRAYWSVPLLAWLLGFNLVLAEPTRVVPLATDSFGLGRNFFGSTIENAYAAVGVDIMLFVVAGAPLTILLGVALFLRRQIRH